MAFATGGLLYNPVRRTDSHLPITARDRSNHVSNTPRTSVIASLLVVALGAGCAATDDRLAPTPRDAAAVRNVILMIADGAGAGLWTAAEAAQEDLAVKEMSVIGLLDTRSAQEVSDSAAAATVFATGERVTNRTISVGPASACPMPLRGAAEDTAWPEGCEPITTWFEVARDKGRATGLVTTTHVVDATPAAFVAHSPSRYGGRAIARQFAEFGLDVLLGGGRSHFLGTAVDDGGDLLGAMCEQADCIGSAEELGRYVPTSRPLVGLFTSGDLDEQDPRPVRLPDMVDAALAKLDRHEAGFVAMFETEATDNATHANLPLPRVTADMLEFDRAVRIALEFTRRTPGTLLIVTSDHETGGFALVETEGYNAELRYSTRGHSANLVPLFAEGPQAERFGGWRENDEIGSLLMDIAQGW